MRLRHIEIFHAVYALRSVSNAAKFLNVSQPSVSKTLRHAEDQLGYLLFERRKGRLIPTKEAHRLYDKVCKIYEQLEGLQRLSKNLSSTSNEVIRIGVTAGVSLDIIPQAVATFIKNHPDVRFDIETLYHKDIIKALYEQKIDVGVVFSPAQHPGIVEQHLGQGEFVCLTPAGVSMPDAERISLADIPHANFIRMKSKDPLGRILAEQIEANGIEFETVIDVATYHVAKSLVRLGVGASVIDEIAARSEPSDNFLICRITPAINFDVKALMLESEPVSLLCLEFVSHLEKILLEFLCDAPAI